MNTYSVSPDGTRGFKVTAVDARGGRRNVIVGFPTNLAAQSYARNKQWLEEWAEAAQADKDTPAVLL